MKQTHHSETPTTTGVSVTSYKATAIILAGGQSTRLGFDKQLIRSGDRYLMDQLIDTLSCLFDEVIIVSNKPELYTRYSIQVVSDHYQNVGPLAGFHAGLKAAKHAICFVTGCDMPWISQTYIHYLMKMHLAQPEKEIWTTRRGTMLEPLGGLYSKSLIERIDQLIADGFRRIQKLFQYADVGYVSEKTALLYSPNWQMFDNINTLDDLELFSAQMEEEKPYVQITDNLALGK